MAEPIKKTNPWLRYGILVLVLALFLWNYIDQQKPLVKSGILEYRMVTGTRDSITQVILLETADRYTILDSSFREIITSEDGELVSRPKQLRLLETYSDIEYRAGFSEEGGSLKPSYRLSREMFNQLKFGIPTEYEVNRKTRETLISLVR